MMKYVYLVAAGLFVVLFSYSSEVHAQEAVKLLKGDSCFTGPFASYDSWMRTISGVSPEKADDFEERFERNTSFYKKEDFESYQRHLDCRHIVYKVGDAVVNGYYIAPKGQDDLPVVLYNRGGNSAYGAWIFGNIYLRLFDVVKDHNIALVATNYRGVYPSLPGQDEFGGNDVTDVLVLPELFSEFPAVNPENIAIYGESRGAMQSLLALKQGLDVDSAVLYAGNYDLAEGLKHRPEMEKVYQATIPNYATNKDQALKARSALFWVDEIANDTPILLIHGDADKRVRVESSIALDRALEEHGFTHDLSIYEGLGHRSAPKRQAITAEMVAWFKQHWD